MDIRTCVVMISMVQGDEAVASDVVDLVRNVRICLMVDVGAVTSRVVEIDVASRLLLNSPIGVRAGSSHSGGISLHLVRRA